MANNKRKDLNIGTFINEVKADQTTTERKKTAPVAETPAPAVQSTTDSSSTQSPIPSSTSSVQAAAPSQSASPVSSAPTPTPADAPYPTVGRPARRQSLLSKKLAKLVYIDEDTELQLKLIKTFQNYDYKEVIFTAIHEFISNHYRDMRLDDEGTRKVEQIIHDYKTRS